MHTDTLTVRAESFGNTTSSFTLRASLLDTIVAYNTAMTATLETLPRFRIGCGSCSPARGAYDSLVELDLHFGADHRINELNFYVGLEIGASRIIS